MPFSLNYYLSTPDSAALVVDAIAAFPGSSAQLVCDSEGLDQAYFLGLVDRLLPEEYLRPLKANPNSGYEIFQMMAAVAERLSEAVHHVECGLVMLYAGGPAYAEVEVTFYRSTAAAGALTVLAGTLISTSIGARAFETIEDAVFGGSDLFVTVTARAIAYGYEYNVRGPRVSAGGEALPGEIDTIDVMLQAPSYADASILVRQETDASGGTPDWLAGHGSNRGMVRGDSETYDEFRLRMRALPDTISPAAMRRIAERILGKVGIEWELIETFDIRYQTCWDAPSPNVGTPTYTSTLPSNPLYDSDLWAYDDNRAMPPFRGRWLGLEDYLGGVLVVVDTDQTIFDYGAALDDPETSHAGFSANGRRGTPAFDASGTYNTGALDGSDVVFETALANLYAELQKAKAAGVSAAVDYYHAW